MWFYVSRKKKVKTLEKRVKQYGWAVRMFFLTLCLSSVFSLISQSLMSSLGIVTSVITILTFIFVSICFDMVGIAVTSASRDFFIANDKKGTEIGLLLVDNSEKVCSFCADVVGDICGILSGAGGASVILSFSNIIQDQTIMIIVSTLVSSLIAGVTIFGKACMKAKAIKNANKIILKVGYICEKIFFRKKQKNSWHLRLFMLI